MVVSFLEIDYRTVFLEKETEFLCLLELTGCCSGAGCDESEFPGARFVYVIAEIRMVWRGHSWKCCTVSCTVVSLYVFPVIAN